MNSLTIIFWNIYGNFWYFYPLQTSFAKDEGETSAITEQPKPEEMPKKLSRRQSEILAAEKEMKDRQAEEDEEENMTVQNCCPDPCFCDCCQPGWALWEIFQIFGGRRSLNLLFFCFHRERCGNCFCCLCDTSTPSGKRWFTIRDTMLKITEHKAFEAIILLIILGSSITLVSVEISLHQVAQVKWFLFFF